MSKEKTDQALGLVRHALTFGGGYFLAKGLLDEATLNTIVTGLVTLVGAVWSWKSKV